MPPLTPQHSPFIVPGFQMFLRSENSKKTLFGCQGGQWGQKRYTPSRHKNPGALS